MGTKADARKKVEEAPVKTSKPAKKDQSNSIKNKLIDLENYLNGKYKFRYNEIINRTEFKHSDNGKFSAIDEKAFYNFYIEAKMDAGINTTSENLRALIESDRISERFNPLKEYLFNLPVWDEQTDWISDYLKQINLIDEEKQRVHFNKSFKKWFVNLVASLIEDHTYNENCLILVGGQGIGKTRFFMSLIPNDMRMQYYYVGTFQPHNKDHEEMLGTKAIINLDELATLNKSDIESLKSRMSQGQINLRRAYGRLPVDLIRIASFCGSINRWEFLSDQSGSRRFLPFGVESIALNSELNIKNLYSQALSLYKKGFDIYFDQEQIKAIEEHNLDYKDFMMEEELVLDHYQVPDKSDIDRNLYFYATTTKIANDLAAKYNKINVNQTFKNKLSMALRSQGFTRVSKRIDGNSCKVWILKERFETALSSLTKEEQKPNEII